MHSLFFSVKPSKCWSAFIFTFEGVIIVSWFSSPSEWSAKFQPPTNTAIMRTMDEFREINNSSVSVLRSDQFRNGKFCEVNHFRSDRFWSYPFLSLIDFEGDVFLKRSISKQRNFRNCPFFEMNTFSKWPISKWQIPRSHLFPKWSISKLTRFSKWPRFKAIDFQVTEFRKRRNFRSDSFRSYLFFQDTHFSKFLSLIDFDGDGFFKSSSSK